MEPRRRRRRHDLRRPLVAGSAVVLTGLLLGWSAVLPAAAKTVEFTISDSRITESSGLATDAPNERYWTVNDSGDAGVAYALDPDGDVQGTLDFRVEPVDVEAVGFHDGRLYVADIGDNGEQRDFVTVYFFDDAEPSDQPVVYKAYDFAYPDGAHNAETLLVDDDGRLYIVTKGASGGIYAAPESPVRQGVNELERVGDAPAFVTDGTVLADGRIVLRTYVSVEVLDPGSYEVIARAATPAQKQGESITTTMDGKSLLIGSEGKRSKVLRIDIPSSLDQAPKPSSDPPERPSASPTGAPKAGSTTKPKASSTTKPKVDRTGSATPGSGEGSGSADDLPEDAGTDRAGTLAALGVAAAVAVVAAGVVIAVRRP
jgi:hypothetical protein